MILVKPNTEILEVMGGDFTKFDPLSLIELAGRTCYKSEDKITQDSAKKFVGMVIEQGHHSVIEHSAMSIKFIVDRGVTHELVRHRLCAFSQESTRYCNYKGGVTFVIPPWLDLKEYDNWSDVGSYIFPVTSELGHHEAFNLYGDKVTQCWLNSMYNCERSYIALLEKGWSPQQARSVLPNSTKTEIVVTANFREWRYIFTLRCSKAAHLQMREVMIPLLDKCKALIPIIFDDVEG